MSNRRCQFCGERYGERDCEGCGRGMCDLCDSESRGAFLRETTHCWDCREEHHMSSIDDTADGKSPM